MIANAGMELTDEELENVSGGNTYETHKILAKLGLPLNIKGIEEAESILYEQYGIRAHLSMTRDNTYKFGGYGSDYKSVMKMLNGGL